MELVKFQKKLREKILVMDGAMGTEIQSKKLSEEDFRGNLFKDYSKDLKGNNDLLNLTQPEVIKEIHKSFLNKGSDFIQTNTFNSSSISQNDYGLAERAYELNFNGARIAKEIIKELKAEEFIDFIKADFGLSNMIKLATHHPKLAVRQLFNLVKGKN